MNNSSLRPLAERYNNNLTAEVRAYLKDRGIPATIIQDQLLGWNGRQITIPVFDRAKEVLGFRFAKLSAEADGGAVVTSGLEDKPELYGAESLAKVPSRVVICAREFDRLALEARDFPAVCSTGGAAHFSEEWVSAFEGVGRIYICFDRSLSGAAAAKKVQLLMPRAHIVTLPPDVGASGNVTTYFIGRGNTATDFEMLLAKAESEAGDSRAMPFIRVPQLIGKSAQKRAERVRRAVRLVDIVSTFTTLQAAGPFLVAPCPLHADRNRSFTLYSEADRYRCSACGSEGDVVKFLMDKESMSVNEALDALECFATTGELYGTAA